MTRLLVLGMLNVQPMSGYDVQQGLQMTDAERWGGVLIGSIYHALKKWSWRVMLRSQALNRPGIAKRRFTPLLNPKTVSAGADQRCAKSFFCAIPFEDVFRFILL